MAWGLGGLGEGGRRVRGLPLLWGSEREGEIFRV